MKKTEKNEAVRLTVFSQRTTPTPLDAEYAVMDLISEARSKRVLPDPNKGEALRLPDIIHHRQIVRKPIMD